MNKNEQLTTFQPATVITKEMLLQARKDKANHPRLANIPREKANALMAELVIKAFLYRGQKTDPSNTAFVASALVDELVAEPVYGTKWLTFDEIRYVIRKAVLEGDIFVCVATLYRALVDYVKGEGHDLQKAVNDDIRARQQAELKQSIAGAMLSAYTSELTKKTKAQ